MKGGVGRDTKGADGQGGWGRQGPTGGGEKRVPKVSYAWEEKTCKHLKIKQTPEFDRKFDLYAHIHKYTERWK